jgi:hypothetical protein
LSEQYGFVFLPPSSDPGSNSDGQAWAAGMYVSKIHLTADGFECRICGLTLDADELTLAVSAM